MDLDGRICLGLTGNMDKAIEASATLLSAAGPKELAWTVLEEGLPKKFPCN
jgi:hypothetical protein